MKTPVTFNEDGKEFLQLLSSAVEQTKESILITDAELNQPGPRIVFVNPAFIRMTGYQRDEVLGKTPRILQGPRTDRGVLQRLRDNLEQGGSFEGETVNYRKDGTEFDLSWRIAPIRNQDGKTTHFIAIQRDVTEHKQLEARMLQAQKMETIGKLAGGVAHEFNSILTAIIGKSEYLADQLSDNASLSRDARDIRAAAERAAGLTRQLLAYGRKQILQPEILDLNQVLLQMRATLQHLLGENVSVRITSLTQVKTVKINPGQIEQVIINLAMNAADAMPNGGSFTLETANVTLDEEYVHPIPGLKSGDYVMLAVSDTGTGMTDDVKARAFEPFFTTKPVGQGTGLGLSTCYGIIKQSNGHINLYSEHARGTTFRIYLPQFETRAELPRVPNRARDLPGGNETILVAEDDPDFLEMTASLLRRLGYTVHTAFNGVEALNLKSQRDIGRIDLLLTDLIMPHMSGRELADRVRAVYPGTRILFTSAYTENAAVQQGILDGGIKLLQKPFTPSSLARKVREALDAKP
jgi:PAS domain S-box-containing protein